MKIDLLEFLNKVNNEHSRNVSKISKLIAKKAGYSEKESNIIAQAAFFHDAGKIFLHPDILNKPTALTLKEYEIIKTHTKIGYEKLNEAAQILAFAAIVANEHHENIDGTGYNGLTGSKLHDYSKIVACADVADALLSHRIYKKPWCIEKVKSYFTEQSGKKFAPEIVNILHNIIDDVLILIPH